MYRKPIALVASALLAAMMVGTTAHPASAKNKAPNLPLTKSEKKAAFISDATRTYYTPSEAKKRHYVDENGNPLKRVVDIPAGYVDGNRLAPYQKGRSANLPLSKDRKKAAYLDNQSRLYYTPAQAKKLHYKNSQGHTLVRASEIPVGYADGNRL